MSLASLFEGDLEQYISENRGATNWFFVHIPKTAGSSFRRELADLLQPNWNVHVDDDKRAIPVGQKLVDAVKVYDQRLEQGLCRFASGHAPVALLANHVNDWEHLKLITMLRDPAERVISHYRYLASPADAKHHEFIRRFPSLDYFIETEQARNRMFQFLRPSRDASIEDCLRFVVDHFAFVGLVEMYSMSVRLMTRLVGQERSSSHYLRKTAKTKHNRVAISSELLERVRELNRLDAALYSYFHDRLRPIQPIVCEGPFW